MATSNIKSIFSGFHGKVGNIIVKQCGGRTILSAVPRKSSRKPTAKQMEVRDRFRIATMRARAAMDDPDQRAAFAASAPPGVTAYAAALKHFMDEGKSSQP